MEISGSTPTAFRQAGRPARQERHRRRTSCCGGTPLLLDFITLHSREGGPAAAAGPFLLVDPTRRPRPVILTQSRTETTRDGPLLYFGENQTGRSLLAPRQAEAPAGAGVVRGKTRPRAAPRPRAAARVSRRRASRQDARLRPRKSRSCAREERRAAKAGRGIAGTGPAVLAGSP